MKENKINDILMDLTHYLDNSVLSDCDIYIIENESTLLKNAIKVRAHRLALCAASDYYDKCLRSGLREDTEGKIIIKGFSQEAIMIALKFIYGSREDFKFSLLEELLRFADMYFIRGLRDFIGQKLLTTIIEPEDFNHVVRSMTRYNLNIKEELVAHLYKNINYFKILNYDNFKALFPKMSDEKKYFNTKNREIYKFMLIKAQWEKTHDKRWLMLLKHVHLRRISKKKIYETVIPSNIYPLDEIIYLFKDNVRIVNNWPLRIAK